MEKGNENILLEIGHSIGARIFSILLNIIGIIFCLFCLFVFENYFVKILFCIISFIILYNISNILFFKKLIFTDKKIIKQYFNPLKFCFMNNSLEYEKMDVEFWNRIWNTRLTFWEKDKKWKTKWKYSIELSGLSDKKFEIVKQILIDKKVINGEEYEWHY